MSGTDHIPTRKLGRVSPGRYVEIPQAPAIPVEFDSTPTDIMPPDDRTIEEWVMQWASDADRARTLLQERVQGIYEHGRQGTLGLTANADERTRSQALAFLAQRVVAQKCALERLLSSLATLISETSNQERLQEVE